MVGLDSYCLASQQIRDAIKSGKIDLNSVYFDETQIQPSSFEPVMQEDVFVLDTEKHGLFRPDRNETIYQALLRLPKRQRRLESMGGGYEFKIGYTYLVPLEEKVKLAADEHIESSPKSTFGRTFLDTRLLGDFNPGFDEILPTKGQDKLLDLWLLIQPQAFNLVLYAGTSVNQLKFFKGFDARLTNAELIEELKKNPMIFDRDGQAMSPDAFVTDGLLARLDLSGKRTEGIIGLRARKNPEPIDTKKIKEYKAEDFFEPITGNGWMTVKRVNYYLLSSKELLKVPPHLNMELRTHSKIGFRGPMHFAGFIDNGFQGDLVFEIRSDELSDIELQDGLPVSKLDVYRTPLPDKLYGKDIGSNYFDQVGPKPAKFFNAFDFTHAARNYQRLNKDVLVQDAEILNSHRTSEDGFQFMTREQADELFNDAENGFFHNRYDCEEDELVLQVIPYVVLFGPDENVFTYVRAADIKDFGEKRLFGKHSIGVGGHITKNDGPKNYIKNGLEREVIKEEVSIKGIYKEPVLAGTLMAYDKPVDRVHFGLVFAVHVDGSIEPKENALISGNLVPIEDLMQDPEYSNKYETWSRMLIPNLKDIYNQTISK